MTEDPFILSSDPKALRREGIPMHPQTAIRHSKTGGFPAPTQLSPHRRVWFRSQLRRFLENKAAA